MKLITIISAAVFSLGMAINAQAGDAAAGKAKADSCAGCHGMNGKSMMPANPNLAGQKEAYLVKAMKAYRDGSRKDPMMNSMAAGLSDADIDDIAAFYASVK